MVTSRNSSQTAQLNTSIALVSGTLSEYSTTASPIFTEVTKYRALIGALLYIAGCTRPDISYSVSLLSRFMQQPRVDHWVAAIRVLRYLRTTADLKLTFGYQINNSPPNTLVAFSDADYARDPQTARSISGNTFFLNGGVISWSSKRQPTVALSTTEAEYVSAAYAAATTVHLRALLEELGYSQPQGTTLHIDNQAALTLSQHPAINARTRHIHVKYHFIRELVDVSAAFPIALESSLTYQLFPYCNVSSVCNPVTCLSHTDYQLFLCF
jgi:hypothetical protein